MARRARDLHQVQRRTRLVHGNGQRLHVVVGVQVRQHQHFHARTRGPSWLTTLRAFLSFSSVCMSGSSSGSRRAGVGQVLRLGDRALQDVQAAPKLVGADAQRRQEPDHIAVKARFHQDQAALVRGLHDMRGQVPGGLVTRWIAHHLERDHGAQPAHVANNAVAPRPGFEARARPPTSRARAA